MGGSNVTIKRMYIIVKQRGESNQVRVMKSQTEHKSVWQGESKRREGYID